MSTQLLSTIKDSFRNFKKYSVRLSISKTHRPLRLTFRKAPGQTPVDLMFCNGKCTEATCLADLCPACEAEYFDWKMEKA